MLSQLFRSFLPLHNPIGFGATDFIELALVALLTGLILASCLEPRAQKLAARTGWCMLLLVALPIALRLLLLPGHPIPSPRVADDFSYLLIADTVSHFRLANPPHPLSQFFETFFVLQQPTYSSIFPLGQGLALALGRAIFGHPWAGVVLSVGAFCSLCYWMLRAWITPGWALLGGLLAALEFGPLNQWMNSYWGGAVSAAAGCLVFGSLPRLREAARPRDVVWLGLGLALQLLTRPFESILLAACVILFFLPELKGGAGFSLRPDSQDPEGTPVCATLPPTRIQERADRGGTGIQPVRASFRNLPGSRREPCWVRLNLARMAAIAALVVLPAGALTLLQNRRVTGSWLTLPYMASRYQYGVPTTFTVEPNPVPHRSLTPEQQLDFEVQSSVHGNGVDTPGGYLKRFASRARFYRFFFLAPLYLALPFYLLTLRSFRSAWTLLCLLIFALGTNFYPYFYSHYIAAETCLLVLAGIIGLERLSRLTIRGYFVGRDAARLIVFLCIAHFFFWYGLHAFGNEESLRGLMQYESWDAINHGDPEGRIAIRNQLARTPGKHLVFVRYGPRHAFQEWVYNAADIDASRVIWARDLGSAENQKLVAYYPGRTIWLLQPDARPPQLTAYKSSGMQPKVFTEIP